MANYMAEIAELYGLRLNEKFKLSGHTDMYFAFSYGTLLRGNSPSLDSWRTEPQDLVDILTGRRKVIKYYSKPNYGENYYVASTTDIVDMYEIFRWIDSAMDEEYFKRGLVFPTIDKAVEATKEIIDVLNGKMVEQQGINHMRDVVELLGVDFEDSFQLKSTTINGDFKFTSDGLYLFSHITEDWSLAPDVLLGLITGTYTIDKSRKPLAVGTEYYIPNLTTKLLYDFVTWGAREYDFRNLKNGLVCRTKEEAIELGEKMLKLTKAGN